MSEYEMKQIQQRLQNHRSCREWQKQTPSEEMMEMARRIGVPLSEEMIAADYAQMPDSDALYRKYSEMYGDILDQHRPVQWFNRDIIPVLICRIIPKHFKVSETGDPNLIYELSQKIHRDFPNPLESDIEDYIKALIVCGEKKNYHLLSQIDFEYFHIASLIKVIPEYHNRNQEFRSLMKKLYLRYYDVPQQLFPEVYEEAQQEKYGH